MFEIKFIFLLFYSFFSFLSSSFAVGLRPGVWTRSSSSLRYQLSYDLVHHPGREDHCKGKTHDSCPHTFGLTARIVIFL